MDRYSYNFNVSREMSYPTPFTHSAMLVPLMMSLMKDPHSPRTGNTFHSQYDYIIVGGGSAGSALASRLSEESGISVLLLEAGQHSPLLTDIPTILKSYFNSDMDWAFKTVPQKHTAFGLKGRQVSMPAGRVLGGTSVMNGVMYTRGNHHDFNRWSEMGATGWSYNEILEYFIKSEDNQNDIFLNNGYHGKGGPVTVSNNRYVSEFTDVYLNIADTFGYRIGDINGPKQNGFYAMQGTVRNGARCSAAKAFLVPAENRTNLDIILNAYVKKIEIKGNPLTATAVLFDRDGQSYRVNAKREIVLSAGTVNTAQLLMLSGVGPRDELLKHDIPVLVERSVGHNLMDHPASFVNFVVDPKIPPFSQKLKNYDNINEFIKNGSGPLSAFSAVTSVAFLKGDEVDPLEDTPNYELYLREVESSVYSDVYRFTDEVYNAYFRPLENKSIFSCYVQLLQPKSRGTVTLNSSSVYDAPILDPNYLDHPQDWEDMIQGLKQCYAFSKTEGFQRLNIRRQDEIFPGCEDYAADVDQYLRCFIKYAIVSTSHQVGTARMGHPADPDAVVDPELRVIGVANLRVVDASVMPVITSGNTMTPVYMIAEKAAHMIKSDFLRN